MRIRRVVTTRAGGRSRPPYDSFNLGAGVGDDPAAVTANRNRLADELGLGRDRLVWMEQVHGRNAEIVDGPVAAAVEATDALVTAEPGLALIALCADCVPVLLADPEAGVVGAVHAGRVGARVGVVPAALDAMRGGGRGDRADRGAARPGRVRRVLRGAGRDAGRRREAPAGQREQDPQGHAGPRHPRRALAAARRRGRGEDRRRPAVHDRGPERCSVTAEKAPLGDWPP